MANLSVASIRERIFNSTKHEENVARPKNSIQQNPFASINGNLLNADVYVSSTTNNGEKVGFSARIEKLKKAAQVASLSNISERWKAMTESVVAFGNRIKEGFTNTWKKLNEWTLEGAVGSIFDRTPSAKYYSTASLSETRSIFKSLEAVESNRAQKAIIS